MKNQTNQAEEKFLFKYILVSFVLFTLILCTGCVNHSDSLSNDSKDLLLQRYKLQISKLEKRMDKVPEEILRIKLSVLENDITKGEDNSLLATLINDLDDEVLTLGNIIEDAKEVDDLTRWNNYAKDYYSTYKQYSIDYLRMLTVAETKEEQLRMLDDAYDATLELSGYLKREKNKIYE